MLTAPRSIEDLSADPQNPRKIEEARLESLGTSLETFGDLSGLTWNSQTGEMVAGHQRLRALKELARDRGVALSLEQRDGRVLVFLPASADGLEPSQEFPVRVVDWDRTMQQAANLTANNPGLQGEFVADGVAAMLDDIRPSFDEDLFANLRFEEILVSEPEPPTGGEPVQGGAARPSSSLAEAFLVPPFSILDARQGYWRERKRAWLSLGIQSEVGRNVNLLGRSPQDLVATARGGHRHYGQVHELYRQWRAANPDGDEWQWAKDTIEAFGRQKGQGWGGGVQRHDPAFYAKKRAWEAEHNGGKEIDTTEFREKHWKPDEGFQGTSIFDPVLCELAYRWFCPPAGVVLDPFAGGSVRGVVASRTGRRYVGIDLRKEQVEANEEQARTICGSGLTPRWVLGDSQDVASIAPGSYDFIFTCPPYFDLEVYSEDARDLSTMSWDGFSAMYRKIIAESCALLKEDRFAAIVVGEVRDKTGAYRNLVGLTVEAFRSVGLSFYNEAILLTPVGSLPIRIRKQFTNHRKLGKTHQNVLVFVKGSSARAVQVIGPVEVAGVTAAEGSEEEEPLRDEAADDDELALELEAPPLALITDPVAITPVVKVGEAWLKRDDLFVCNGARGSKARTAIRLLRTAQGATTAGNRFSPMVSRVARVAEALDIPARCHCAGSKELSPEEKDAAAHGGELVKHKVNYLGALCGKARKDAEERGWVYVALGMESPEYIEETRKQAANIPPEAQRVVITVGSGMALAALLHGLEDIGRRDMPVLGVVVGFDPEPGLEKWAPKGWRSRVELVKAELDFTKEAEQTRWWGVDLDPHYEAKAAPFVKAGDLFWVTAISAVEAAKAAGPQEEAPPPSEAAYIFKGKDWPPAAATNGAAVEPGEKGAAWQRGFPLETLKGHARLFRGHDEGLVLGAFQGVKENQIAEWLAEEALVINREAAERGFSDLDAAIVVQRPKTKTYVEDFSGRRVAELPPGTLWVRRMAFRPGKAEAVVKLIQAQRKDGEPVWIRSWQEHAGERFVLEQLRARWACTKVAASSELLGIFVVGEAFVTPTPPEELATLVPLNLPRLDVGPLCRALATRTLAYADHYSSYNKGHAWSALSLRGFGGRADFIEKPSEMSKKWKQEHPAELAWPCQDTPLRAMLPEAEALIAAIPGEKERVRLMRLAPGGGELTRHADITDPDAGVADGRILRIHIPIATNPGVVFTQWKLDGSKVEACMGAGESWYLDTRKPHCARNGGQTERVHLVLDVKGSQALRDLLVQPPGGQPPPSKKRGAKSR